MITKLVVRKIGGFWKLKQKCCGKNNMSKFYRAIYNMYVGEKNSFIPFNTQFLGEPIFPHGIGGIHISENAVIGKNTVIYQQVTIGENSLPDSKNLGGPVIGENCYIGAGAKIIGAIRIGDNVRIGANCVVFTDIPDNSVVVMQAPRIIQKEQNNNRHYTISNGKFMYYQDGSWIEETDETVIENFNKFYNVV